MNPFTNILKHLQGSIISLLYDKYSVKQHKQTKKQTTNQEPVSFNLIQKIYF